MWTWALSVGAASSGTLSGDGASPLSSAGAGSLSGAVPSTGSAAVSGAVSGPLSVWPQTRRVS